MENTFPLPFSHFFPYFLTQPTPTPTPSEFPTPLPPLIKLFSSQIEGNKSPPPKKSLNKGLREVLKTPVILIYCSSPCKTFFFSLCLPPLSTQKKERFVAFSPAVYPFFSRERRGLGARPSCCCCCCQHPFKKHIESNKFIPCRNCRKFKAMQTQPGMRAVRNRF